MKKVMKKALKIALVATVIGVVAYFVFGPEKMIEASKYDDDDDDVFDEDLD